jgi:uncharacterized protein YecE (DUF72 family)
MGIVVPQIGCCGFRRAEPAYAARFPVVEVEQTFYDPPMIGTLKRWRASVPAEFEFTLMAWQLITHPPTSLTYVRLRTMLRTEECEQCGSFQATPIVEQAWAATEACAAALEARQVLFQCPDSFTPTQQHLDQMRKFFSGIRRNGLRLLWEPPTDCPEELVKSLCEELDLVHVVDPFFTRSVTPDRIYFRLRGCRNGDGHYSEKQLRELKEMVGTGGSAYVIFNNEKRLRDATRFLEMARPPGWGQDLELG